MGLSLGVLEGTVLCVCVCVCVVCVAECESNQFITFTSKAHVHTCSQSSTKEKLTMQFYGEQTHLYHPVLLAV